MQRIAKFQPSIKVFLYRQFMKNDEYKEALDHILDNPDLELQRGCLKDLIFVLLQNDLYKTFVDLDYKHLTPQVAKIAYFCFLDVCFRQWRYQRLVVKVRMSRGIRIFSILSMRFMFNVVNFLTVAFIRHILLDDCFIAARAMYEFAWRLKTELQSREILQKRCRILSTVFQTMHMFAEFEYLAIPVHIVC